LYEGLLKPMKTARKFAARSAVAFLALAFAALMGFDAEAGPITPPAGDCMLNTLGGTDCSFTSYAQCEELASGEAAECYGSTARDDRLPVRVSGGTIY
jgi:hypothetical protein